VAYKFTVKMKVRRILDFSAVCGTRAHTSRKFKVEMTARRILHEKTQRFLRGWCAPEEGVYIDKEQRLMTFLAHVHIFDATSLCLSCYGDHGGVGWGWDKFCQIERKNNKCRSFPPALPLHTYTRVLPTT